MLGDLGFRRDGGEGFFLRVPLEDIEVGGEIEPEAMADGEGGIGAAVDEVDACSNFFDAMEVRRSIE
jgi:hypothetical protein